MTKKPINSTSATARPKTADAAAPQSDVAKDTVKMNFSDDSALAYIVSMVPEIAEQLSDSNWKVKLAGMRFLLESCSSTI